MAKGTTTTTNHDEIRRWVEERGGKPSTVKATATGDEAKILRIDFAGYSGRGELEEIDWDVFFEKFDAAGLAFVYQDETADGRPSRFYELVDRRRAEEQPAKRSRRTKAA